MGNSGEVWTVQTDSWWRVGVFAFPDFFFLLLSGFF